MSWALDYRPKRFQDLLGQEHVVRVLANLLKKYYKGSSLPAAFLFSGSRGTGKTTSARVVAAMLNCTADYIGKPGTSMEPCCKCESCLGVIASKNPYVYEMDAASSGLVDDIRKIKDMASLCHEGKTRVFIIDEAHGLTNAAFEALLKQLEEPMPNVIYVLCTTEAHKFPDTILSRSMIFNFKPLVPELIAARLQKIATDEGIAITDSRVFQSIAMKAGGAMRDGIMMLEQLANYKIPLTMQDFLEYYGLVGSEVSITLLDMARKADVVGARNLIGVTFTRSVDFAYFLDSFMVTVTDSLHAQLLAPQQVVDCYKAAVEVKAKLKFMSAFVSANYLFALLLRVFAYEGAVKAAPVTSEKLTEMFT